LGEHAIRSGGSVEGKFAVKNVTSILATVGMAAVALSASSGLATTTLDLTVAPSSGTINGALFRTYDLRAAGSGVLHSFVRVSSNATTEQGYNTSGRPVAFDENTSPTFTHDALLSDFPTANIGGTNYYEFILDINQTNSSPLLSVNAIQIYTSTVASQTTSNVTSLGTLRYNMDNTAGVGPGDGSANDYTITLNYQNFTGSGQADMVMYVPVSNFGSPSDYVYLYSYFGVPNGNNDGYEEWAHRDSATAVPMPQAAAMGLAGLTGLVMVRRRKTR
jgi:MYXO-CTERM domain-containing protein